MRKINKRKLELCLIDFAIVAAVYGLLILVDALGAASLKVNNELDALKLAVFAICLLGARMIAGTYQMVWRYADARIYVKLVCTDLAGSVVFILLGRLVPRVNMGFAYSAILAMLVLGLTLCSRFFYQYLYAFRAKLADAKSILKNKDFHVERVAIVGAGNVGAALANTLLRNPKAHYAPICFVDTDPDKIGNTIHGLKVYRDEEKTAQLLRELLVDGVIIALPDLDAKEKERLYHQYKEAGWVKLYAYTSEEEGHQVREFEIEDLLFRESITIQNERTAHYYSGKTVLITGGGGSIGSELCRQVAKQKPRKLIIVDIYENNAYEIQQELRRTYGDDLDLETIIASVRDAVRLEEIFSALRPQVVIHAAAHKHVPLMENSPGEAVKNNIIGTYNTANMAEKYGAERFLLISTDKAVNPTNIMGASKRLCEMVVQCRVDSKTEFAAVRFGNVLGSNGSVIPLFKKQIAEGGPITITDKRIVRFFMTIPEAVQLVLEAGAMAKDGELFVLDMGEPVKILDLAENLIRLSGYTPYQDIDIVEIGLRPGEKLYEELLMANEELGETENKMIFVEHDRAYSRQEVDGKLQLLLESVATGDDVKIVEAFRKTVPTYCDPDKINKAYESPAVEVRQHTPQPSGV